ncbi:MAG: HAMP domain-containing histidine kinase [Thermoleophilaceae bacterium]|nr:HAMP domain-containing histidine kinase [Thermoleophilaceae bacterium]
MSFRRRLTLAATAAVCVVALLLSVAAYILVRNVLRDEIDQSLRERARLAERLEAEPPGSGPPRLPPLERRAGVGEPEAYVQTIFRGGRVVSLGGGRPRLPVDSRARELARRGGGAYFSETTVGGTELRILTSPLKDRGVVQIARSLTEVNAVLSDLRAVIAGLLGLAVVLALLLGRLVARAAIKPVERLTEASEHVAATRDLSRRIDVAGDDELARLARSFNTMLDALEGAMAALERSLVAQRRLVADASHELRTPLTSLRTNVEVLRDPHQMSPDTRRALLADVNAQLDELSNLVADLVDLARDDERVEEPEDVRLDTLVAETVRRFDRHARHVNFQVSLEPTSVEGRPDRLQRAVANLLDNAAKFSPEGATVDVALRDGELSVRDRGPGIPEADLPHVFDRFYRSLDARAIPGSGLGLAIVRQVSEAHGGVVTAEAADGGGTIFRLSLRASARPAVQAGVANPR